MNSRLPRWLTRFLVRLILPAAWLWVRRQERRILRKGRPLSESELRDAAAAGVTRPEAIRLLVISPVPTPGGPWLRGFGRLTRFPMKPPAGMALGNGIFLDTGAEEDRRILVHECAHVAQYERLGGSWRFLDRYLEECLSESYWDSALEREANATAARVCRPGEES